MVQTDQLNAHHAFVILAFATSDISGEPYRLRLEGGAATGLNRPSEVRLDQLYAVRREKIGKVVGRADEDTMREVDRALAFVLGLRG